MIGYFMKYLCILACLLATPAFAQQPAQFSAEDYQAALIELGAQNVLLSNRLADQAVSLSRAKREVADQADSLSRAKREVAELAAKLKDAESKATPPSAPN